MKTLLRYLKLRYNMWKNPEFKALIELDSKYVVPSTWDDPLQMKK